MPARWRAWWDTIEGWRKRDCLKYDHGNTDVIKPQFVVETLWNMTKDADTYITSDVGQHQMWAAQYYRLRRAAALDQFRRPGHHGRGHSLRHGHQAGQAR